MTHNPFSRSIANGSGQQDATQFVPADLADALKGMATGITRPRSVRWVIDDAVKGKPVKPLGNFPRVAEAIIDAGGSYHYVAKPLSVMLAHLRRRCRSKLPADLKTALQSVKKECDEAEACALSVAFAVQCPAVSDLATLEKELDEAILVSERARELVADRRAELEAR